jgi:hypothetical protein
LAPGQVADELQVHGKVVGESPGDVLTVTAEATTTSRELSTANNTGQAYVEATISVYGAIWDFTTPNVGDEATDSDVVWVFADEFSAIAESHVFEVASGSETIIDVGLTEEPLI